MRKPFLYVFFLVVIIAILYKSPFSAMMNYNKAKSLYDEGQYEKSIPYFERSLFASPEGILARYYYVQTLSKSKPTYSVQKKLYEMSESKIQDEATKIAKIKVLSLRRYLLRNLANNYIFNATTGNDILRWNISSFPLKVYIENNANIPKYYYPAIKTAFESWSSRTNFLGFEFVDSETVANIVVKFKDMPTDVCTEKVCKYTVAYTNPDINKANILTKMDLTFYKTNPKGENFTNLEIFNTALHEIGHTLGIMGHSDYPSDIMYSTKEQDILNSVYFAVYHSLSQRDLNTLVLLYRLEPTISNLKENTSENLYYPPLILGGDEVRLQKKLDEYLKYVQEYPTLLSGYVNLSSVYADLGEFDKALNVLAESEKFASSRDDKFLVLYNRAVIYFNKQDYDKALASAQQAKAQKSDQNVEDMIIEIKKFQNKK